MNKIYLYGWEGYKAYQRFKELEVKFQLEKIGEVDGFLIYESKDGWTNVYIEYCLMEYC